MFLSVFACTNFVKTALTELIAGSKDCANVFNADVSNKKDKIADEYLICKLLIET